MESRNGTTNSLAAGSRGSVGAGTVNTRLTQNFGSVGSMASHAAVEESDAAIAKAIQRHDKARDVSTWGAGIAMPFTMIPGFRGVGSALASSLGVCEGYASNDEEVAKAGLRLRSLVPALERASELAQRGSHPAALTAVAELERSLMRVVALFDEREHAIGKLAVTTFKERFKSAIDDVERSRNDLMLCLNLEAVSVALDGGGRHSSATAMAQSEIPVQDLFRDESQCLGAGAYGKVYRGEWQGSVVAIKTVSLAGLSEPEREGVRKSLQRELSIMVQLRSPRIVHVYGLCMSVPDQLWLVIEYVSRGSLRQHLDSLGSPPDAALAQHLLGDTALGLKYLHGKSIVHGDLKTHNLLLDDNLRAKVADFGLSAMQNTGATDAGGGLQGSVPWLSPENLDGAKPSTSSDVFAFGVVCWEVVTGEIPWKGESLVTIMKKVCVMGARPPLPKQSSNVTELMQLCWAQDVEARPPMSEIADALREVAAA